MKSALAALSIALLCMVVMANQGSARLYCDGSQLVETFELNGVSYNITETCEYGCHQGDCNPNEIEQEYFWMGGLAIIVMAGFLISRIRK